VGPGVGEHEHGKSNMVEWQHEYTTSYVDSKLLFKGGTVQIPLRNVKCGTFILSADRCN